jgi:hypothetical protein
MSHTRTIQTIRQTSPIEISESPLVSTPRNIQLQIGSGRGNVRWTVLTPQQAYDTAMALLEMVRAQLPTALDVPASQSQAQPEPPAPVAVVLPLAGKAVH